MRLSATSFSNANAIGTNRKKEWKVDRGERSFGLRRRSPPQRVFVFSTFYPLLSPPNLSSLREEKWSQRDASETFFIGRPRLDAQFGRLC